MIKKLNSFLHQSFLFITTVVLLGCVSLGNYWSLVTVPQESGLKLTKITDKEDLLDTEQSFAISKDGTKVVFTSWKSGNGDIYIKSIKGGKGITQRTSRTEQEVQPSFSPDGSQIVFCSPRGDGWHIYMIQTEGGSATKQITTSSPRYAYYPSFSTDGKKIVFSSDKDTKDSSKEKRNANLWVVNSDGTGLTQLTFHLSDDICPVWSPDMTGIYFLSSRGEEQKGVMNIWRLEYDNK